MDDLIERMAIAMCEAQGFIWEDQASPLTSASGSDQEQEAFRDLARAALGVVLSDFRKKALQDAPEGGLEAALRPFAELSARIREERPGWHHPGFPVAPDPFNLDMGDLMEAELALAAKAAPEPAP